MKKQTLILLCFLIVFIVGFFLLFFLSNINLFRKKEVTINNILSGNTFYLNEEGESYIKFISNEDFEFRKLEDNDYIMITGKYKLENDNIILDNKDKFIIIDDMLFFNNNSSLIYFNSKNIVNEIIKLRNIVINYVNDIKKNNPNLAYPKDIKIYMNKCYLKNNSLLVCSIDYNIYFDNYIKSVCDQFENDKMFFPYTGYSGYCENEFVRNKKYFEIKKYKETYKLINVSD